MGQARIDDGTNRARYSKARENFQPGPAVMRAGSYLAVVCLIFGAALAAFVPGSLEQRLGNLFSFGLMTAVGFYAGGYVLGRLLVFRVKLCDTVMARCSHYGAYLANALLDWASAHLSKWLADDVHTRPNAEGPNGDGFRLEVRRGWRPWFLFVAGVF